MCHPLAINDLNRPLAAFSASVCMGCEQERPVLRSMLDDAPALEGLQQAHQRRLRDPRLLAQHIERRHRLAVERLQQIQRPHHRPHRRRRVHEGSLRDIRLTPPFSATGMAGLRCIGGQYMKRMVSLVGNSGKFRRANRSARSDFTAAAEFLQVDAAA